MQPPPPPREKYCTRDYGRKREARRRGGVGGGTQTCKPLEQYIYPVSGISRVTRRRHCPKICGIYTTAQLNQITPKISLIITKSFFFLKQKLLCLPCKNKRRINQETDVKFCLAFVLRVMFILILINVIKTFEPDTFRNCSETLL